MHWTQFNMTRETKIRIAVALVISSAIAWVVWMSGNKGELKIAFAGVSSNDSGLVWFTITNTSKARFIYIRTAQEYESGRWIDLDYREWKWIDETRVHREIAGHAVTNFQRSVTYLKPWRIQVAYAEPRADSLLFQARTKLSRSATRRDWQWLSRWAYPKTQWKYANSVEFLGDQPKKVSAP
jgi:hypothetical protein